MRTAKLVSAAALIAAAPLLAHPGPRVWIGSSGGTLATFIGNNNTNPSVYTPRRVFVGGANEDTLAVDGQLGEFSPGTGIFATEYPAYQVRLDGNAGFGMGRSFGFNLTGPILVFNAARQGWRTSCATYFPPGPIPQIGESAGSNLILSGDGPVSGFNFFSYNFSGDHGHITATLYGDGASPVDGPHVVYAVPMQLTTSGLTPSATYYMLYGRDVPLTDSSFQSAISVANAVFHAIAGDANIDGKVNALDFNAIASNFGSSDGVWNQGDFNFDSDVNTLDFNTLAGNFGRSAALPAGLSALAPEPSLAGFLVLVGLSVTRRSVRLPRPRRHGIEF